MKTKYLDTNVVLRLLLKDDSNQFNKILTILDEANQKKN